MINKQSVWFVTLFSLILVLSIYYVTLNDNSLQSIIDNFDNEEVSAPESVNVEESSVLVSLRVQEDESVLKQMENYQSILLDSTKTSEEKNNAFNSLMALNQKRETKKKLKRKLKMNFS